MPLVPLRVSAQGIVVVALLIVLLAVGTGFMLDARGFAGNLLSEVAGILIGVLLTVFVIDALIARERTRRWRLVSTETLATLRFAVIRAGLEIYLLLPAPRPPRADPFTSSLSGRDALADSLRALGDAIKNATSELDPDIAARLRPHLGVLRDGVMPRLLTIGEHDLIARLAALEGAVQELEYTVWLDGRFGNSGGLALSLASVAETLADVAAIVDEDHLTSNPVAGRAAHKAAGI